MSCCGDHHGGSLAAILTRMVRTSMLEELSQDYVRTRPRQGIAETHVVYRHALRNARFPSLQCGTAIWSTASWSHRHRKDILLAPGSAA